MASDDEEDEEAASAATAPGASAVDDRYSHEQRIVAAVWVHERGFNRQSWQDIEANFRIRFGGRAPDRRALLRWERRLFAGADVRDLDEDAGDAVPAIKETSAEKCGRPLSRLMHVPYVRASLDESPELSLRERSKLLGLPRTTLLKIIRDDLGMEYEVDEEGGGAVAAPSTSLSLKRKHAPFGGGKWTKKTREGADNNLANNSHGQH